MIKRAERIQRIMAVITFMALMGAALLPCNAFAATRTRTDRAVSPTMASGREPVMLVLPFQVNAAQADKVSDELPEILSQRLIHRGFKTVPIPAMLRLLESRKISTLDVKSVRSLASAAGATHAVYGSISEVGGILSIDARLVETSGERSARPLFVEQSQNVGITPALEELANRVSGEFVRASGSGVVAGIEVRGLKVLDPEVVLLRVNTRKGDTIDTAAIDRDVNRVWELGYFSDVRVLTESRPEGTVLIYAVAEKPRIESIAVEGNSGIDTEDITSAISSKSGSILNEKLLADDLQKVIELYRKKGYYLAKVTPRTDMRQGGASAALVLAIDEGKKLYVSAVKVEGVKTLDEGDVADQLLLAPRSIISWITGTGVLKEELLERDSAAISSYYLNHGFLDVSVGTAKVNYTDDGIEVIFPVAEGPRYKLGTVSFSGDLIDTDERLRTMTALDKLAAKQEYFNLSVMQDDAKKLTDYYADYGYAFTDVNPRPKKHEGGEYVVDITYDIEKKNKVFVRRVIIEGNNKTRDNVILREMRLTDGDQFEGSKLRRSTERLNKLGYFEVAEAELVPTGKEDEVDLKVKVKEKPTGALMGGVGYSTFSSFGVSGTLSERNLWGKGYNVSLQAGVSGRRDAYTFAFTNPHLNDTALSVGFDIYHWRDDYIDYTKRTTGGVLRFAYPLGEYTSLGWGYRLDQYRLYDLDDDASNLIRRYATGDRISSVALGRITRDTTNRERPTDGNIDRLAVEYGGGWIGGDDDFITVSAEHQTYFQIKPNHILHGRVKGSAIFTNGSPEVPVFERFWMGGIDSVRGYDSRDIVPRDQETGDRIGGTRMAFANLEYIWSVSTDLGVNLVPFFDIGFNIDADHSYNWDDEIKKSFGLELRWRSPMGDLRFSYGIPLDDNRKGDRDSGRFEFSMGQFF